MQVRTFTRVAILLSALFGFLALTCFADSFVLDLVPQSVIQQRLNAGTVRGKHRQNSARALFEQVGCTVQEQKVIRSANLICDLAGDGPSTIIVGAHLDFAEHGDGIVDDWSGTALLSSLYQNVHSAPRKHTFRFIAFTGEESGLVGSTLYVKSLSQEERSNIRGFINLECLGVASPNVWVHRSNAELVSYLVDISRATHVDLHGVNVEQVGDDDTHPFFSKKIPVISIHSLTQETFHILHTDQDTIKAIRPDSYYAAYRLIAFYLVYLDSKLP